MGEAAPSGMALPKSHQDLGQRQAGQACGGGGVGDAKRGPRLPVTADPLKGIHGHGTISMPRSSSGPPAV